MASPGKVVWEPFWTRILQRFRAVSLHVFDVSKLGVSCFFLTNPPRILEVELMLFVLKIPRMERPGSVFYIIYRKIFAPPKEKLKAGRW